MTVSVMESVNQRTQLVGQNRLDILTFRLDGKQRYGINVFKVKEVLPCPSLTKIPNLHPWVCGIANVRDQTISIVDLNLAIGGAPTPEPDRGFIIISEFNRSVQGFLVQGVERISNLNWEEILPPPAGAGRSHHLTAVTHLDNDLLEILDVEKILSAISPEDKPMSRDLVQEISTVKSAKELAPAILIADDSMVARKQVAKVVEDIGFECITVKDGKEALEKLKSFAEKGPITEQVAMVISDIEMPEMDGYTFTAEVWNHASLKHLHVVLHTSLSGVFNQAMVERVGAAEFISKFNSDELGSTIKRAIEK